jgi:hypothetical protein
MNGRFGSAAGLGAEPRPLEVVGLVVSLQSAMRLANPFGTTFGVLGLMTDGRRRELRKGAWRLRRKLECSTDDSLWTKTTIVPKTSSWLYYLIERPKGQDQSPVCLFAF